MRSHHLHTLFYRRNSNRMTSSQIYMFDLDGTLVNSEPTYAQALQLVMKKNYGATISDNLAFKYVFGYSNQTVFDIIKSNHSIAEKNRSDFLISYEEEFKKLLNTQTNWLISPTVKLFNSLVNDNFPVCIVSGSSRDIIAMALERMGLKKNNVPFIGNEDYINGKPHPEPYLTALERIFNLSPDNCSRTIVFEDSMAGVQASKAANMYVIGFQHPSVKPLKEVGAHYVLMQTDFCSKITNDSKISDLRKWLDNHLISEEYQKFLMGNKQPVLIFPK